MISRPLLLHVYSLMPNAQQYEYIPSISQVPRLFSALTASSIVPFPFFLHDSLCTTHQVRDRNIKSTSYNPEFAGKIAKKKAIPSGGLMQEASVVTGRERREKTYL